MERLFQVAPDRNGCSLHESILAPFGEIGELFDEPSVTL
jgi:hypothetical protein